MAQWGDPAVFRGERLAAGDTPLDHKIPPFADTPLATPPKVAIPVPAVELSLSVLIVPLVAQSLSCIQDSSCYFPTVPVCVPPWQSSTNSTHNNNTYPLSLLYLETFKISF
uniref:Uncharacterized protein n=1 Tax=Cuerna arida TaxID=1464854 RepID=A0A1B6ETW1_9HEMI